MKKGVVFLILCIILAQFVFSLEIEETPAITTTETGEAPPNPYQENLNLRKQQLENEEFPVDLGGIDPNHIEENILNKFPNMNSNSMPRGSYPFGTTITANGIIKAGIGPEGNEIDLNNFDGVHDVEFDDDANLFINGKQYVGARITADGDNIIAIPIDEYYDAGANLTIMGGTKMESSPNRVLVEYAESINILDHTLDKVHYFFYDMGENIKLEQADSVYIDGIRFNDIVNSSFRIAGNELINTHIKARKNSSIDVWNPINGSFDKIQIHLNKNKEFDMDFRKTNQYGQKQIRIEIEPGVFIKFFKTTDKELRFNAKANKSSIEITEGEPPAYEIDQGNLTFSTINYSETLDGVGTAYIDNDNGAEEVILNPFLVIEPGGRYTYEDKQNKEKSFSLFNHGFLDFYLGLNKQGEIYYETYKQGKTSNWGFIDFLDEFKEFNGIISYEKYGSIPITQNIQELRLLNIYTKNDINNKAGFTEENNDLDLYLRNSNPEENSIAIINYGTTEIDEKENRRFLRINQIPATYYMQSYKYGSRPEIIFNDKTAKTNNVVIYNVVSLLLGKSDSLIEFEGFFNLQIASINEQFRSYHLYMTEER